MPDQSQQATESNKILWLSIIQGYAILLVVIGHVNGFTYQSEGEFYPLTDFVHRFCYSFHMPLFMFVSGGLLYLTRIKRHWKTLPLYKDKVKRLLLPFILFTTIGFLIKIPFAAVSKNPPDISFTGFLDAFFTPSEGPLKEMWFIGTLMWLMFLYPIYKSMLKNPYTEILLLSISLIPFLFGTHIEIRGWFNIAGVTQYAFYFIAGILFFKYNIISYFEVHLWAVLSVIIGYAILFTLNIVELKPLTAFLGIMTSFAIGIRIVKSWPNLFSTFRDHSFQIFLVGIFPQMFLELIVWKRVHSEYLQIPFYMASVILALYSGVLISKLGSRIPFRIVRWGLGLK